MSITLEAIGQAPNEVVRPHNIGDCYTIVAKLKFTGNYTTGGVAEPFTEAEAILKQLGLGQIMWVEADGAPGFVLVPNYATGKLQVFQNAAGAGKLAELAAAAFPAELTGGACRIQIIGV